MGPLRTLEVAPPPSDRVLDRWEPSWSSRGWARKGCAQGWRCSSRSGGIMSARGCRSARWRRAWGASPGGAAGAASRCRRVSGAGGEAGAEARCVSRADRCVAGGRSVGAAQAASHRASGLAAAGRRARREVSERQVSRYVRERRLALGVVGEAFVPQLHAPGIEAEVDWGEATVVIGALRTKVHSSSAPLSLGRGVRGAFLTRPSRRSWRRTSRRSRSSAAFPRWCATTTSDGGEAGARPSARRVGSLRRLAVAFHVRVALHAGGSRGRA